MVALRTELIRLFPGGDRREVKVFPAALFQKMTHKIIDVEPLHDEDDGVLGLVVEPAEQCVANPQNGTFTYRLRHSILGFHRIIDNQEATSAPRDRSTHRRRQAPTSESGRKLQ